MSPIRWAAVPFLLVVATGCGSVTWGSRGAKHYPITAQVLETQTLDPCAVSLSTMQQTDATLDALSGSTTTNADLLKAVRKASKTARIRRDAAPSPLGAPATATPSILTTRFGAPTVSTDTWNLVGAAPSPASGELASRVRTTGAAYSRATMAQQMCFMHVMGGNLGAMGQSLHEKYDDELVDPQVARAHSRKLIGELRTIEAREAALTGILAAYEGALAGQVDPAMVDKLVAAMKAAGGQTVVPSDADVESVWAFAKEKADALDAESKKWGVSEHERLALLGVQGAAAREPSGGGDYGAPAPPGGGLGDASGGGSGSALVTALKGLLTGNLAAVVQGAAELLPQDNPFVIGLKGAAALASGDYITAMKQASLLAPKDSTLAVALALPDTARSVARSVGM